MEYLRLPNSKYDIRISSEGTLKSFDEKHKTPNTYLNRKGYVCSWYITKDGKNITFRLHRMVGLLFLSVPDHLKGLPLKVLQINHKDTNKLNNTLSNLEWVTNSENMKHARENGCFSNEKRVLIKNEKTGKVTIYKSLSHVCRLNRIKPTELSIHLNQRTAGCVIHEGLRYKFDNDQPWCEYEIFPGIEHKFSYQYRLKIINQSTQQTWLGRSLAEICNILNLNINVIKNTAQRGGMLESKDKLWRFEYIEDNDQRKDQMSIIRLDRRTGSLVEYSTLRECAKENDIEHSKLFSHLTTYMAGMLPWNGYFFKYNDGFDFPNVDYLIPNACVIGRSIRWIIYCTTNKKMYPLTSLSDLCRYLNIDIKDLYHHLERIGYDKPFLGYTFKNVTNLPISEVSAILKRN